MNRINIILRTISDKEKDNFKKKKISFEKFKIRFDKRFRPYRGFVQISDFEIQQIYDGIMKG